MRARPNKYFYIAFCVGGINRLFIERGYDSSHAGERLYDKIEYGRYGWLPTGCIIEELFSVLIPGGIEEAGPAREMRGVNVMAYAPKREERV